MPVPGTQVTVSAGQSLTLQSPLPASVSQTWQVEIDNFSPYILTLTIAGQTYTLAPGMAQLYTSSGGPTNVSVVAGLLPPTSTVQPGQTFSISSLWATFPDTIPGTFPTVVSPLLANISATVLSDQVSILANAEIANGSSVNVNLPANVPIHSLAITARAGDIPPDGQLLIVGNQSLAIYYGIVSANSQTPFIGRYLLADLAKYGGLVIVPFQSVTDKSINIAWSSAGSDIVGLNVVGYTQSVPAIPFPVAPPVVSSVVQVNGSSTLLVAGVAHRAIVLHSFVFENVDTTALDANLNAPSGTPIFDTKLPASSTTAFDLKKLMVPGGDSIYLASDSSAALCVATLLYQISNAPDGSDC